MYYTGNQLYDNLKKIARKRGYTIKEVCQKIGMTPEGLKLAFINNSLKLFTAIELANLLGIKIDEILMEKEISKTAEKDTNSKNQYRDKYYKVLEEKDRIRDKFEELREKYERLFEKIRKDSSGEKKS
jgi:transcriptional regulator with XRE-family HTH domain